MVCTVIGSAAEACTVMSVDVTCTAIVHKCCCLWKVLLCPVVAAVAYARDSIELGVISRVI